MAFTHVQSNSKALTNPTSDTFTNALTAGAKDDLVILCIMGNSDPQILSAAIPGESSFTMLPEAQNNVYAVNMGYLILTSGGPKDVDITWDDNWTGHIAVLQFSADRTIVYSADNKAGAISANSSVSLTTTVDGSMIISAMEKVLVDTPTPGIGYTGYDLGPHWAYDIIAYNLDVGLAGVKTVDFTFLSTRWTQQAVAFHEVASSVSIAAIRRRRRI